MSQDTSSRQSAETGSLVLEQLRGKQVLLTGTTGFLGKVVLEKLIRAVPDIGGITLLIRGNGKYASARERFFNEVACSSVFEHLKINHPDYFDRFCTEKIDCVTGEITEPYFSLTPAGFEELAEGIDAVINSAASVDFREELDKALAINALSLRNITELVRTAGNIPVVQVSTCYVHGHNGGHIHEELIRPASGRIPRDHDGTYKVEDLIFTLQDRIAEVKSRYSGDQLKEKLVELGSSEANRLGWNDTYTLTKWIGEQILARELRGGSVTIVRPSIIESTLAEPVAGWVEGVKVADAIIMGYARGKVVFFPGRREGILDVIPADLVANSVILSLAEQFREPGRQRIYQCCSGSTNPITLGEFSDHVVAEAQENHEAYPHVFKRRPTLPFMAINRYLFRALTQGARLPLGLLERSLRALGQSADQLRALEHFQTTMHLANIFGFYTCPTYVFHNDRLLDMASRMRAEDRRLFPVDARRINWERYIRRIHLPGLEAYALQERKLYRIRSESGKRHVA